VLIRIEGTDLPGSRCHPGPLAPAGYTEIRVGVQRRGDPHEILEPVAGDAPSATWALECAVRVTADGVDITGPYIQGRPRQRFIYLSWLSDQGTGPLGMFRRGKIRLDALPDDVLRRATPETTIVVRVRLSDDRGNPACATLGPPTIAWEFE
jgi:hypothetical protein